MAFTRGLDNTDSRNRVIFLASDQKSEGTNEAPIFEIETEMKHITSLRVVAVSMPHSDYNMVSRTINWQDAAEEIHDSEIPDGAYDATELADALTTLLNADKDGTDTGTYLVTADITTQYKFTFTRTPSSVFNALRFSIPGQEYIASVLGFTPQIHFFSTGGTGTLVYNLVKWKVINIHSDIIRESRTISFDKGSEIKLRPSNRLITVPRGGAFTVDAFFEPANPVFIQYENVAMKKVGFRLEYRDGTLPNLNGIPWVIILEIEENF